VPRLCKLYPGIYLTTEEKHGKPQGTRKRAGFLFPSVGDVGRRFVRANVCQAVQISGSPHQLTSSRISQGSDVVGEIRDSQIIVNLPVTTIPEYIGSNAKTLGLQDLKFLDMGASGRPPNGKRIVHHGTDELLIRQITIPGGETNSPIQERPQRSQSLPFASLPDRYVSTR
jgi:hypothetical protein